MRWFLAIAAVDTVLLLVIGIAAARLWPESIGIYNPVAMFAVFPLTFLSLIFCGAVVGGPLYLFSARFLPQRAATYLGVGVIGGVVAVTLFFPSEYEHFTIGLIASGGTTGLVSGYLWWRWVRAPEYYGEKDG